MRHPVLLLSMVLLSVVLYHLLRPVNPLRVGTLRGVEKASRELWITELHAERTKGMSVADLTKARHDEALATLERARQAARDAGASDGEIRHHEFSGRGAGVRVEAERLKEIAEEVSEEKESTSSK